MPYGNARNWANALTQIASIKAYFEEKASSYILIIYSQISHGDEYYNFIIARTPVGSRFQFIQQLSVQYVPESMKWMTSRLRRASP